MENSKPKSSSSQTPAEDSTKTAEVQTEEEEEQSEIRKVSRGFNFLCSKCRKRRISPTHFRAICDILSS